MEIMTDNDFITSRVNGVDIYLDEQTLGKILGIPTDGIKTVTGQSTSREFLEHIRKLKHPNTTKILKKQLTGLYQFVLEMVNKVFLPRTENRSIAGTSDLFLMEALSTLHPVNLPAIMLDHMKKILSVKDGRHGLAYGFFLTRVFHYHKISLGVGNPGTRKYVFSKTTLE